MPRIHKNIIAVNIAIEAWSWSPKKIREEGGIKKAIVKRLIIIMLVYSAIKISAKGPLLYSVLKPETNSDSPSAKSKGVRLVSARIVVNQQRNRGGNKIMGGIKLL